MAHPSEHTHNNLAEDLERMLAGAASRRQSLRWLFAGAAAIPLAGCGGSTLEPAATTASSGSTGSGASLRPRPAAAPAFEARLARAFSPIASSSAREKWPSS